EKSKGSCSASLVASHSPTSPRWPATVNVGTDHQVSLTTKKSATAAANVAGAAHAHRTARGRACDASNAVTMRVRRRTWSSAGRSTSKASTHAPISLCLLSSCVIAQAPLFVFGLRNRSAGGELALSIVEPTRKSRTPAGAGEEFIFAAGETALERG